MDGLDQVAHQLVDIEAYTLNIGLNDPSAVLVHLNSGELLVLGVACLLGVRLTLVDKDDLLDLMAVRVLVDTIAPNVGLANVRSVLLSWCRSRIDCWRWGWSSYGVRSLRVDS